MLLLNVVHATVSPILGPIRPIRGLRSVKVWIGLFTSIKWSVLSYKTLGIVVQIVDACPAGSALNYCKAKANPPIPADERCGQGNALDIDYSAYKDLTGTDYSSASVGLGSTNLSTGLTMSSYTEQQSKPQNSHYPKRTVPSWCRRIGWYRGVV